MKLLLVDSMGVLYRGHFAMISNPLRAPDGTVTSGLAHMLNEIQSLVARHSPEFAAAAFDHPGPGFRNAIYEEYKANRPPMPDDLAPQARAAPVLLEAMGIPVLRREGFEADDLIASAAAAARIRGIEVLILSSDKDLLQLVEDGVTVFQPGKPGRAANRVGPAEVPAVIEVEAGQVADLLALAGDSSDNVPGARGIGPKTAAKLLAEYGSLEAVYASIESISPPSLRRRLVEGRDAVMLSRRLVELRRDALPGLDIESLRPSRPDPAAIPMLEKLGLKKAVERLTSVRSAAPPPPSPDGASAGAGLPDDLEEVSGMVAVELVRPPSDINMAPGGFAAAWAPGRSRILDISVQSDSALLRGLAGRAGLASTDLKPVLHGLASCGIDWVRQEHDLSLLDYVLSPGPAEPAPEEADGAHAASRGTPAVRAVPQDPGERALAALAGCLDSTKALERDARLLALYRDVELPLARILVAMERRGVALDMEALGALRREFSEALSEIEQRAGDLVGTRVNLNSPSKVSAVLFETLKLPRLRKTGGGADSSSITVLQSLRGRHPFVEAVIEHRELAKLLSTYVERLPGFVSAVTGLIHTRFNQAVTATGRLSSSNPNLQNIPIRTERGRRVRKCFRAGGADEVLVSLDYSQIELRILAHMAGEGRLRSAYRSGRDIHSETSMAVFGDASFEHRRKAKEVNFSIVYGITPHGLAQRLGISRDEAAGIINRYFETYPEVEEFYRRCFSEAEAAGETRTLLGRRRFFPDLASSKGSVRKGLERMVMNTTIQGSAADMMKLAMIKAHARIAREMPEAGLVLQVHDELVAACPREAAGELTEMLRNEMESAACLEVPLAVECGSGSNWLEAGH
ncbi:DNA polymerase I [Candidatus Fermentibacteria bacterium]|nr:DNA polymerase I [Candidatus Fermentibacteria bacterium]